MDDLSLCQARSRPMNRQMTCPYPTGFADYSHNILKACILCEIQITDGPSLGRVTTGDPSLGRTRSAADPAAGNKCPVPLKRSP